MLVALGGKCLAGIANGLRKKFTPYAVSVSNFQHGLPLFYMDHVWSACVILLKMFCYFTNVKHKYIK